MPSFVTTVNSSTDHHSGYKLVKAGTAVTIAENKQSIVYQEIEIENTGIINLNGELVIIT